MHRSDMHIYSLVVIIKIYNEGSHVVGIMKFSSFSCTNSKAEAREASCV